MQKNIGNPLVLYFLPLFSCFVGLIIFFQYTDWLIDKSASQISIQNSYFFLLLSFYVLSYVRTIPFYCIFSLIFWEIVTFLVASQTPFFSFEIYYLLLLFLSFITILLPFQLIHFYLCFILKSLQQNKRMVGISIFLTLLLTVFYSWIKFIMFIFVDYSIR